MACQTSMSAFGAFESQLKTLCLQEFPCGLGTWKENYGQRRKIVEKDKVNSRFTVTLKGYGAHFEKTETLEELVTAKDSPWNLDYSWSDEAKDLREIAVRSPWLIDERFVLRHFKTLRIIDKQVEEVDVEFLKFECLEELSLSANVLRTVHAINLPSSLRVLELCANRISHLADLCLKPPPLIHLGLGYNRITLVDDYISGQYWPRLLSLDLSHNNLCDMMDIVKKLQTLPKLGNLIMQGNPLALIPAYRGYVIDSLKRLNFLDDISISADERHHYKGLSKRREFILDEGKVTLKADYIKGVPMPEEMKNPDEQPEYPVITRKYSIQFHYPEDKSTHAEIYQILQDDQFSMLSPSQTQDVPPERPTTIRWDPQTLTTGRDSAADGVPTEAAAMTAPEIKIEKGTTRGSSMVNDRLEGLSNFDGAGTIDDMQSAARGSPSMTCLSADLQDADHQQEDGPRRIPLAPIQSDAVHWAEEMELAWSKTVSRDELLALRDFFRQGMDVSVVEEKVRSYPADQMENGAPTPLGSHTSKMSPKKEKKDDKSAGGKGGKSEKTVPSGDKKKKKGEPEVEMVEMPPEFTTLRTFHVPLSELLEGERFIEKHFTFDWESEQGSKTPTESEDSKKDSKKDKKRRTSASSRMGKGDKDRGKSPKPDKKEGKDKKGGDEKGKSKSEAGDGDESAPPPQPPLEINISISLHHWKTALDSLKPDVEEKPAEEETAQ